MALRNAAYENARRGGKRADLLSAPARRNATWRRCAGFAALLMLALGVGSACASSPRGATEANFAKAKSGSANGWELFRQNCAGCHGERGESVSGAPRIMGEGALPELPPERNYAMDTTGGDPASIRLRAQTRPAGAPWRDPFRSAQDVYNYVSKNMPLPEKSAGSLSPDQYWAIVNFMLLAHGVAVPPEGITQANAASVKF